jgi:hypothetical protein
MGRYVMIREVDIVKVYLVAVGGAAVATMIPTRILPRSLLSLSQQRPHIDSAGVPKFLRRSKH